ncbi:uncharacterized protein MYCFIDRAFT_85149 [Pseudocercospora fijiensis CIRAD86]|uniref:F-box domain-containing protein n=1 Tax=Pseudocercospora fijiensis (strain CIRAD86) TaxID=383855 RepID=M3A8F8_PSEFD|nr:uncharacterized protein MYCFIDRAFT_85149 [Pseudocercospora fijiensis CIRAD86]EME80906.1 hypothetical protein MYCFIDRAFT_85149 [Pseudocercospora fijiensis CIRAD86]
MNGDTNNDETFNFFGLPREVRDSIYDYLTVEAPINVAIWLIHLPHAFAYVLNAPRPSLLQVSSPLRAEYMQQVEEKSSLRIIGPTSDGAIAALLTKVIRPFSDIIERCEIFMPITCHDCREWDNHESRGRVEEDSDSDAGSGFGGGPSFCGAYDLLSFYTTLLATKFLPNFRKLHTIHLRIGMVLSDGQRATDFDWPHSPHSDDFVAELCKLVLLPVVESLDLVICQEWADYRAYCQSAGKNIPQTFSRWRRGRGWLGERELESESKLKAQDSVLDGFDELE